MLMPMPTADFADYDAVLLDLDGTLLVHDRPCDGAAELLGRLEERDVPFAVLTNSTLGPRPIRDRLAAAGMDVDAGLIYTASAAACDYVVRECRDGGRPPRVFNCGAADVDELLAGRATLVESDTAACDAIIVGTPANARATPDRQRTALRLARRGARLVGTCADRVFPGPDGGVELGAGALTAMLAFGAAATPIFCGKPEESFFNALCDKLAVRPDRCLLVGDNLESDVAGGNAVGMATVLVLNGVSSQRDAEAAPPDGRPRRVIASLRELLP